MVDEASARRIEGLLGDIEYAREQADALRARVTELEAERRHANMLLEQRTEDLATARTEAADAMRERAAAWVRSVAATEAEERIADRILALPLTDDAREDGGSDGE